ncbi:SRPBCC domain-containing protein [Bacillus glycinifermentans]|uniref:SRPBCC domain-containing protein n=2 Tax=Bacillus glycinifermentans TaxID=1664069 RepID=UPI002DB86373|nr:SRPBCC domain-containing protein [Bacillus glycinifermentans]
MSDKTANNLKVKIEGRSLVLERLFNAPRDLVFKAFSEVGQLESWWGPKGWKTENRKFAFQPNGVWHYGMRWIDENQGGLFWTGVLGKGCLSGYLGA